MYDSGTPEYGKDVLKEVLRNRLGDRDLSGVHGACRRQSGEFESSAHRVVGLGGDSHLRRANSTLTEPISAIAITAMAKIRIDESSSSLSTGSGTLGTLPSV